MNKETECALARDLLPGYLDNVTSPESNAFIGRHLSECERCRTARRAMLNLVTPAEQAQSELLEKLRRAHLRRRRRIRLSVVAALLLAGICLLPLPRPVHQEMQAVRWQGNTQQYETVRARMEGVYLSYLFRADCFRGRIEIEGILPAQDTTLCWNAGEVALLTSVDEMGLLRQTGFVVAAPGMSEFLIGLYADRGQWDGRTGLNITGPAATREEAVARTQALCRQFSAWLWNSKWEGGQQ